MYRTLFLKAFAHSSGTNNEKIYYPFKQTHNFCIIIVPFNKTGTLKFSI